STSALGAPSSTTPSSTSTAPTTTAAPTTVVYVAVKGAGAVAPEPEPEKNAHAIGIGNADGRPAGFQSGAPEAYWIWREGALWHLRTTTKSQTHKFTGWVAADGLSSVMASKLEVADKVHVQNKMMHFEFTTGGAEDGLDFKSGADECVR